MKYIIFALHYVQDKISKVLEIAKQNGKKQSKEQVRNGTSSKAKSGHMLMVKRSVFQTEDESSNLSAHKKINSLVA